MSSDSVITVVSLISSTIIALVSIRYANKNNRQQIRTGGLEELYQAIQILSRHYGIFKELWFKVQQLRDSDDKELRTLEQYYQLRDQKFPDANREKVSNLLSRIEVLAECYTTGELKSKILKYETLMYSFYEFVFQAGSIQQEIHFRAGYPDYEAFYLMVKELKEEIVKEIKV